MQTVLKKVQVQQNVECPPAESSSSSTGEFKKF